MTIKWEVLNTEDQENTMLKADEYKIKWLFENYSGYRIAKESGVSHCKANQRNQRIEKRFV